mmetsp:Transcript_54856/g.66103  ORF Transcript_54856/g.66103 Transcript_54856/m.66103 type:complete len:82 (+) Transcript_54856:329-574(+)
MLVTGFDLLKVKLFKEGLIRIVAREYSIGKCDVGARYMHLTNYAVSKKCRSNGGNDDRTEDGECSNGHKIFLSKKFGGHTI